MANADLADAFIHLFRDVPFPEHTKERNFEREESALYLISAVVGH